MYTKKRVLALLMAVVFVFSMTSLVSFADPAEQGSYDSLGIGADDFVIFYTNDVHGGVSDNAFYTGTDSSLGYAGLAALKAKAIANSKGALLVDNGDSIQGSVPNTMRKGQSSIDLMKVTGYDILVPGNHEFDFGVTKFIDKAKASGLNYICANFTDQNNNLVFNKAYDIRDVKIGSETKKVAFIGIDTPESISKGTPKNFQDKNGNYIYSFNAETNQKLYDLVQKNIDAVKSAGADFVIVMSHLGDNGGTDGWYSQDVIANTSGIDVLLDGHAHNVIPSRTVKDKAGKDVLLTSTGTKLVNIGVLKLSLDGGKIKATSSLVNKITDAEKATEEYKRVDVAVKAELKKYEYLEEKIGYTDYSLMINDPANPNKRLVRNANTNMADFITDSYLWYAENDPSSKGFNKADAAIMNGGSIRANIKQGEINYLSVLSVLPWNTKLCEIKVSGQTIVDALEMGAKNYPDESGGFLHGGGITYEINTSVKSNVVTDDKKLFVKVNGDYYKGGYRVQNVRIGGKPIDLKKTYNLMITEYYYKEAGDGMTMFKDAEAIVDGSKNVLDIDIFNAYLRIGLNGKVPSKYENPYGEGRTVFTDKAYDYSKSPVQVANSRVASKKDKKGVNTGDAENIMLALFVLMMATGLGATLNIRKHR